MRRKIFYVLGLLCAVLSANVALAQTDDLIYPRKMVVEEWTGTWCGMCVRGIVGMHYMEETYGHENFIGLAVHVDDMMEVGSYRDFTANFILSSYPGCIINRSRVADPSAEVLESFYHNVASTSYAMVKADAVMPDDGAEEIEVAATVSMARAIEDSNLQLAFVITENQFGPFPQQNTYSGGVMGPMGGWEKEKNRVVIRFDHVVREAVGCLGIEGSLPATLESGKDYHYTTAMPLEKIKDINNCTLVALLINTATSEIINADKIALYGAGVDGIDAAETPAILQVAGGVRVSGNFREGAVYGIDGRCAGRFNAAGEISLPSGIYIVTVTGADGDVHTRKIIL